MQLYDQKMGLLNSRQRELMEFLYETMPTSDAAGYPFELFLEFCDHALMLRDTVSWCAELDQQQFLQYVLYHRINDEDLSSHRPLFYQQLFPRIQGLSAEQAVLETNIWCHENATYQAQDDRTASPLTVYRAGSGRCGEESSFAVAALRSVGIAARQVYAPRWSHCDDNHAWVEAWCGGKWQFFGACEPEPVLNRGWFNTAASRAMLVHSRCFVAEQTRCDQPNLVGTSGRMRYYNQTSRYAKASRQTFQVLHHAKPVAGALIRLEILNESFFYPIAEVSTGPDGTAEILLGEGDVLLTATHKGQQAEMLCHCHKEQRLSIDLEPDKKPQQQWLDFEFLAPKDAPVNPAPLTEQQRQQRSQTAKRGNLARQAKLSGFYDTTRASKLSAEMQQALQDARSNFEEIYGFLTKDDNILRPQMIQSLSLKDLRDVSADLLEHHLEAVAGSQNQFPADVFQQALLCPRISNERLTAWRKPLAAAFSWVECQAFRQSPEQLWNKLRQDIKITHSDQAGLLWPPDVTLAAGCCNADSLPLVMVGMLRSLGIPARLNPHNQQPEFWNKNGFDPVVPQPQGNLSLHWNAEDQPVYRLNWTLSRRQQHAWKLLQNLSPADPNQQKLELSLPAGEYRLLCSTRLPSGNQKASEYYFELAPGQHQKIQLRFRDYSLADLLTQRQIPSFSAQRQDGSKLDFPKHIGNRPSLLFWLEEGAEPTEHVLNEMAQAKLLLQQLDASILFFLRSLDALTQPTLHNLLKNWPEIQVFTGEWDFNLQTLAYHLHCDPERPPLAVVCDANNNALYATSGYNVGSVELMARILAHNKQSCSSS